MQSIFPALKSKPRFPLDLSLLPVAFAIHEFAAGVTELFKIYPEQKSSVLIMRSIHMIFLYVIFKIAKQIFDSRKILDVNYTQLAIISVTLATLGEIARRLLAEALGLSLGAAPNRLVIVLVQGLFWIPIFIIVSGRLTEILSVFRAYEKRLLTKTRFQIRTSLHFKSEQETIEAAIRENLKRQSSELLNLLANSDLKFRPLSERNAALQPHLKGNNLRELSLSLEIKADSHSQNTVLGQNLHSLSLLSKQFTLLYKLTAQKSPLSVWVYTLLSTALLAPSFATFFQPLRLLVAWPLLFLATYLVAKVNVSVLRSRRKNSITLSNFLIILLGFLPIISNRIGQFISPDPETYFSFSVGGLSFACGYYLFIRYLQITQPIAISIISADELKASPDLEKAIFLVISREFSHAISHRWAIYIHGKILTRLAATSLKLEQATMANDETLFEAGIKRIESILVNPAQGFHESHTDLQTEITSRLDPWEGLIKISVHLDPTLASVSNSHVSECGEAIEEIISNSVRHGSSQNINVSITRTSHPDVLIVVEDDATNALPLVPLRIGLGTRILNLVSDGRWTINHEGQKTIVTMTMSLFEGA